MGWMQLLIAIFTTLNLILPELLLVIKTIREYFELKKQRLIDAMAEEVKIKTQAMETQARRETQNLAAYMLVISLGEKQTYSDLLDLIVEKKEDVILARFLKDETIKAYDKVNEILFGMNGDAIKAMEIHKIMKGAKVAL